MSQEDVNKIFTALSHEIRREIIRILAEESPKTFSELMNELDIRDTGTMVFHLRKLEGLITKNERGEYVLTDLGRRAYQIMNQIKTERKEEVKEVSEKIIEKSRTEEKIIEKRETETISKTMIISDRLNLYIDKEFLENIRSSGRKIILRDIVNLTISDDIDPNLFNEIVEEISNVISIRAPKKLRPLIELKSRDVLTIKYSDKIRERPSFLEIGSLIGDIADMVSTVVTTTLSNVFKSFSRWAGRGAERFLEKKLVYSGDIPDNISKIKIEIDGGAVYTIESDKPQIMIYSIGAECDEDDYNIDYKDDKMILSIEGCVVNLSLPKKEYESLDVDVAGGILDLRFEKGFKDLMINIDGGTAKISASEISRSHVYTEVNGGLLTLKLDYKSYERESEIDLEINGGLVELDIRLPQETKVIIEGKDFGGYSDINIDKRLLEQKTFSRTFILKRFLRGGLLKTDINMLEL